MSASTSPAQVLDTSAGEFPLHEYRLRQDSREWTILHTGAVLTRADEARLLNAQGDRLPYGVALWPSAIAVAHEVATRGVAFRGRSVLELGAGTGLPGIVAASLGGRVVQTDRDELAMSVCRRNGARNRADAIEYRLSEWTSWDDAGRYDWILGSDILYGEPLHPDLRRIFETNLAPGGRVLLADPFRAASLRLLEAMEGDGWRITMNKWDVGEETTPRPIGVFELTRPRSGEVVPWTAAGSSAPGIAAGPADEMTSARPSGPRAGEASGRASIAAGLGIPASPGLRPSRPHAGARRPTIRSGGSSA
jgi:predicted nicotinamide N-methyase